MRLLLVYCYHDFELAEFYDKDTNKYNLGFKTSTPDLKSSAELIEIYMALSREYPIVSIEDPFDQDDWDSWTRLTSLATTFQVVADDLTVSNPSRILEAHERRACNALLLKINQIGTITESIKA
jgi:enolase